MHDLRQRLRASVSGRVEYAAATLAGRSRDFGRAVTKVPAVVVEPNGEDDVARVLELARAERIQVVAQGSAHSCNGQALSDGGILLAAGRAEPEPVRWLEGDRVDVAARCRLGAIERELHRRRRQLPVLPDYLDLTVGGVLAVGGYGIDSIVHGAMVNQVERLRVVTPDGRRIWCSDDDDAELFRFTLAGLGQTGYIERAVMKTTPYRPVTTLFTYDHRNLLDLVDSLAWMVDAPPGSPSMFKGLHAGRRFRSWYGVPAPSLRAALAARSPAPAAAGPPLRRWVLPRYRALRSLGVRIWIAPFRRRRKLWSDYLFDYPGLRAFARFIVTLLERDAFAGALKSIYLVGVRQPATAARLPLEAAGSLAAPVKFGIGFYTMLPPDQSGPQAQVEQAARDCLARCIDLGGRPYLYGWHRLDDASRQHIYGSSWQRLLALRTRIDPTGIMQTPKLLTHEPSPE